MDADAELDGLIDATCPKRVATPSSLLSTVPRYHSSGSGDGDAERDDELDGLSDALGLMDADGLLDADGLCEADAELDGLMDALGLIAPR